MFWLVLDICGELCGECRLKNDQDLMNLYGKLSDTTKGVIPEIWDRLLFNMSAMHQHASFEVTAAICDSNKGFWCDRRASIMASNESYQEMST